ncbi:epidermal growth factor receptor isoform X2 [Vespula squamosa]|uniref:Epidermal growth factor receptor isoform X2 n=1 Tax=Vespula squamosa TaxID=30214 RepID=A0ABD2AD55_VESSQ
MGLGTIFVLYVSFMLIYSDQADVIEERVEATVLAKLMEKAGLLAMSLTARKINERSECVTKIIPIPYTVYVHRVFISKDKRGNKKGSQSYYRYRYKWIINFDSSLVTLRKENIKDSKHY